MDIRGSHDKLDRGDRLAAEIALETTLADTLDWWRNHGHDNARA